MCTIFKLTNVAIVGFTASINDNWIFLELCTINRSTINLSTINRSNKAPLNLNIFSFGAVEFHHILKIS